MCLGESRCELSMFWGLGESWCELCVFSYISPFLFIKADLLLRLTGGFSIPPWAQKMLYQNYILEMKYGFLLRLCLVKVVIILRTDTVTFKLYLDYSKVAFTRKILVIFQLQASSQSFKCPSSRSWRRETSISFIFIWQVAVT